MFSSIILCVFLATKISVSALIFENSSSIKLNDFYDFIVVGAGAAGAVVASRLSEDKRVTVLLLECGGDENPILNAIPYMRQSLRFTEYDWAYRIQPQKSPNFVNNPSSLIWSQGKGLGGSTAINGMVYIRGNPRDFESVNNVVGGGWSRKEVLRYFRKSEDCQLANCDAKYHHKGGYLTVSNNEFVNDTTNIFFEAAKELGIPKRDVNGESQYGIMRVQHTIRNGERWSTNKAFLQPVADRQNLHILKYAQVTKVLFITNKGKPHVSEVVYYHFGKERKVKVTKEVILSAGAVGSPHILLHSGIGPAKQLIKFNIKVVADLEGVGENLQDQPMGVVIFAKNLTVGAEGQCPAPDNFQAELLEWTFNRTGILTAPGVRLELFLKTRFANQTEDLPDIQCEIFQPPKTIENAKGFSQEYKNVVSDAIEFVTLVYMLKPQSRGFLRLNDTNPLMPPIIDPQLLDQQLDFDILQEGVNLFTDFTKTKTFKKQGIFVKYVSNPECEKFKPSTEDFRKCSLQHGTVCGLHIVGSCKMGVASDPMAVVDGQLRVFDVEGLRVIDASIMPQTPNGNTMTPTIMIGERGSDFIKDKWKLSSIAIPNL